MAVNTMNEANETASTLCATGRQRNPNAARPRGRTPGSGSRTGPRPSVVLDAMRGTGCILPLGRGPPTTGPGEPAAGEVVETECDDDREEFADEIEQTGEFGEGEEDDEDHPDAVDGA